MEKKKYITLEMEIKEFEEEDVITTSSSDEDETEIVPG